MALIEHLDRDDWEEFLRSTFEYVLWVLKNDRFRSVGSGADDLRSWLAVGGIGRVRRYLNKQMEMLRFSSSRKSAVNRCIEQLARENRRELLDLTRAGVVPATGREPFDIDGLSAPDVQDLLERMLAGERPFEEWMHAHGHSAQEIEEVYRLVDRWLMKEGVIPSPPPFPNRN